VVAGIVVLSAAGVKKSAEALQPGVMKRKREMKTMIFVDLFGIVSAGYSLSFLEWQILLL
jgi:hypothetical protein